VALPEGVFYPLLDGAAVAMPTGGGAVDVSASVEEIPAFVPAGTLLVLWPDTVDTVVAADAACGAVTAVDVADDRELWLWPGGASEWVEPGGLTYAWGAEGLSRPFTGAIWNGTDVPIVDDSVSVSGPGTLAVNDQATLDVTGGAEERRIVVRLR
jgi:hypothetical protein